MSPRAPAQVLVRASSIFGPVVQKTAGIESPRIAVDPLVKMNIVHQVCDKCPVWNCLLAIDLDIMAGDILAERCAGESKAYTLPEAQIRYGKRRLPVLDG